MPSRYNSYVKPTDAEGEHRSMDINKNKNRTPKDPGAAPLNPEFKQKEHHTGPKVKGPGEYPKA